MELHRLKPMEDYDPKLFGELYSKTRGLVKKLSRNIDTKRFNVSQDILESWFDDKFIYVFNKYHKQYGKEVLLGHIINSLKLFKYRILKTAYSQQSDFNMSLQTVGDDNSLDNIPEYDDLVFREELVNNMWNYMRANLDKDAFLIFELECCPPEYCLQRVKNRNSRISSKLYCEFLELDTTPETIKYIDYLRKVVSEETKRAGEYFKNPGSFNVIRIY